MTSYLLNSFSTIKSIQIEMWRSCQADSYSQAYKDGSIRVIESGDVREVFAMLKAMVITSKMIEDDAPETIMLRIYTVNIQGIPLVGECRLADWHIFFNDYESGQIGKF